MLKIITLFYILLLAVSIKLAANEKLNQSGKDYYLCIKVKKNLVEYCSNKIFGKQDSFLIKKIAINQMTASRPPINKRPLNYQALENQVSSGQKYK